MLWSRSANLTMITRMSLAIESISLRTFSACPSSRLAKTWSILVSPSLMWAIPCPNSASISSSDRSVSSTVSWRIAATTETSSKGTSRATIVATSSGCEM